MAAGAILADFDGEPAFELRADDGSRAWVVPGVGANCISFQVRAAGTTAHILSSPPTAAELRKRPISFGFPILAPHPGQHRTPFTWRGVTHSPDGGATGRIAHGFAAGAPWDVVDAGETWITCRFKSESIADGYTRWPWPFSLTATYRLEPRALTLEVEAVNNSSETVPHMMGMHPFFPLRFTAAASDGTTRGQALTCIEDLVGNDAEAARETCLVKMEANSLWPLQGAAATGEVQTIESVGTPWDLREARSIAEIERLAGGLKAEGGGRQQLGMRFYANRDTVEWASAAEGDPAAPGGAVGYVLDTVSGVAARLEVSAGIPFVALYISPNQPYVSLEPRSALQDALTLVNDPRRIPTGIWPLAPGAAWRAWGRLTVFDAPDPG